MFHRVLDPQDPRWATCDPDYTLSIGDFAQCLSFFSEHYNVISQHDLISAQEASTPLPPRALLITFDDGWSDNVDYAFPLMRTRGMPGLLFVVSDAVDRSPPFFQEQLIAAWRSGRVKTLDLALAIRESMSDMSMPLEFNAPPDDLQTLRSMVKLIEDLPASVRDRLLDSIKVALFDPTRHMISRQELSRLDESGISVGSHGTTHTPMTRVADLQLELAESRKRLAEWLPNLPAPATLSFPHGRFDEHILRQAFEAGYQAVFTSVPCINTTAPAWPAVLGRLGIDTEAIVDRHGEFSVARLALHLFLGQHRRLS